MKHIKNWILGSLLAVMLAGSALADYQKGLDAYHAGDYATALAEWTPLAEAGDAYAQNNLGVMYDKGEGVLQDDSEAVKWYRRAAEAGDAVAQNNLGAMYGKGEGVLQDHRLAYMWFNLAAAQGDEDAKENRDKAAKRITSTQRSEAQEMSRRCLERNYKNC